MSDTLENQLCDLFAEAEISRDANGSVTTTELREMGYTEPQISEIHAAQLFIATSDDPKAATTAVKDYYAELNRQADIEQFIAELPERERRAEIELMAKAWHIPASHVEWCLEKSELWDNLMFRDNPFIRR